MPWWLAVAALGLFGGFTTIVLPEQARLNESYTAGVEAPDTRFWYPGDALYAAAEAWGEQGRARYVAARLSFDVVWPLVYGFFVLTSLTWLSARLTRPGSRWRRLVALPVLVVLLDYAENVCTATVMARYPARTPVLAEVAGGFTAAKWLCLGASFLLVAAGVVGVLVVVGRRVLSSGRAPRGGPG